jgi:hypothetical protein
MAAYYKVDVVLNSQAVQVGLPSPQSVRVTLPLVGPQGPQGPAGPKGDPGEVSGSIAWDNVTDKPTTFPPSSHTHVAADVTDFATAVAAVSPPVDWNSLTGKPATFAPSAHTHPISDVTNLQTALDGKAASSHTHTASQVTDFNTAAAAAAPVQSVAGRTGAVTLAVADVSGAVASTDSRLTDSRQPTLHGSTHHTGGTDAIAPNNISAAWAQVLSQQTITGNTLLTAGRNRRITLFAVGVTANVDLPFENNQAGDIVTLVADWSVASTLTIRRATAMSGGTPLAYTTLATLNVSGQSFSFVSDGTATGWSLRAVDTHTHPASAITDFSTAAAAAAPVQSVNGNTGTVTVAVPSASTATPQALGTTAAGTSDDYSRGDHIHAAPALNDLSNVSAATPSDNDVLVFDTATSTWVAEAPAASGIAETLLDAKGDLIVASAADTAARLAVGGTNGHVLTVDSTETLGVKWAAPAGGGSSGTKTYAVFTARDNQPTASSFMTLDSRNAIAVLDADDAATESAVFVGILPEAASLGSGLIVSLRWMATTATSGDVRWSVAWEKSNTDLDSDSFDTATAATATANGTSGIVTVTDITCTNIDSLAALDLYRLRVQRLGADGADTMNGDAELVAVEIRSAA